MVVLLSEKGVYISAGSACASGSLEPSPVLLAMGLDEPIAHAAIRLSICRYTTEAELDHAATIIPQAVAKLRSTMPAGG